MCFAEGTLENFRHTYFTLSARGITANGGASLKRKSLRERAVNRSTRRKFSVPEAKP